MQDFLVLDQAIGPIKGQQGAIEEESRDGVGWEDRLRHSINNKLHFIQRILIVKNHLNERVREVDALNLQIVAFAPSNTTNSPRRASG